MAKFITCENETMKAALPVNIDLVQFFELDPVTNSIIFYFQGDDKTSWDFTKEEGMRWEYDNLITKLTQY